MLRSLRADSPRPTPTLGRVGSLLIALVILAFAPAHAQPTLDYARLIDSIPDSDRDDFGWVAADGDIVAVGAPYSRLNGAGGTVHIFERSGPSAWTQTFIVDEFPLFNGNYIVGEAVSVSGGTVAVGLDTRAEIALYSKASGGWARDALIPTSNRVDCLVLEGDDLLSCHRGRVEHRQRQTDGSWLLVSSFVVASFTDSIDIEGDIAVIGDRAGIGTGSSSSTGQAFIAERDAGGAFRLVQRIIGSQSDGYDEFGDAVAVAGDRVVVAAPGDEVATPIGGALYVFERDVFTGEWLETDIVTASDSEVASNFGLHVAWQGGRLLVGRIDDRGSRAAYLLEVIGDEFVETAYLRIGDYAFDPWRTHGVALTEDFAFVGIGPTRSSVGTVHAFAMPTGTDRPTVTLDPVAACPTSTPLTVTGTVAGAAISSITGSVDGGFSETLCTGCGDDPTFSYDAPLAACANTIRIDAINVSGFGAETLPVIFDTVAPSVGCPADVLIMERNPNGLARVDVLPEASASDGCDAAVAPACERDDADNLPIDGRPEFYRAGTNGITCTSTDACGNQGSCAFAVEVLPFQDVPTPDAECDVFDLRDEVGGGVPGFLNATLGVGAGGYEWMTSEGVELFANASRLAPDGETGAGFLYREIAGGFRAEIPVPEMGSDGAESPLGGLMVRWGVSALAPTAYIVHRPIFDGTIEFGVRTAAGVTGEVLADPIQAFNINRLAIEWANGEVEVQVSIDNGNTWTTPSGGLGGSAAINTAGLPTWAGMVVSSESDTDDVSFIFPDIVYCPRESVEPPPPTTSCSNDDFDDDVIGSAWTVGSLGNANQVAAVETGGALELTADGTTAFSNTDNGGFVYQAFTGDFRVEVTVDGDVMTTGGPYRKAGLMIRSSLDEWAPRLLANVVPYWNNSASETHIQWVARQTQNGSGSVRIADDTVGTPRTVRLAVERAGADFKVEYSTDSGVTWNVPTGGLGGTVAIAMPATVLVGLDVVANNVSITSTARFDDFVLCPPRLAFDDFDDGIVDPAWTLAGVGNANQESVVETGGVLELTADGATAFYGADNAGFLYRAITGDFRAEVTVDGSTMTTGGAYRKAGLMVRQSLDKWDVRLIAQLVPFWNDSPTETHLQFVAREAYGEPGRLPVATDVVGVPRTVRLAVIRVGDTLSVEYSTDGGTTWTRPTTGLGGSITIPGLLPTLLVGLDMVSNDISTTSTARFDDFVVLP